MYQNKKLNVGNQKSRCLKTSYYFTRSEITTWNAMKSGKGASLQRTSVMNQYNHLWIKLSRSKQTR